MIWTREPSPARGVLPVEIEPGDVMAGPFFEPLTDDEWDALGRFMLTTRLRGMTLLRHRDAALRCVTVLARGAR